MRRGGRYTAFLLLLAALLLPGTGAARERSRILRAPQDSTVTAPNRDSLRKVKLYRAIDSLFWGQLDTETLPCLDSMVTAYMDSIAQFLPDTHDIKRAMRRIRKEERDSLRAAKPRVLETYIVPDSLYFRRILVWTSDKAFNEFHESGLDTTANANFSEYPMYRKDVAATYLGPVGSATLYHDWFRREETPDAPMFSPYIGDSETDETIKQYNTNATRFWICHKHVYAVTAILIHGYGDIRKFLMHLIWLVTNIHNCGVSACYDKPFCFALITS